jgi:ATP-dependent DNA helicase RecG
MLNPAAPDQHDNINMTLQIPIPDAGKIYKMYSSRLAKLEIFTLEDILYHFPFRYDDFSLVSEIAKIQAGEIVTVRGQVLEIENVYTRNRKKIQKALLTDGSGTVEIVWYNQPYITKYIRTNDTLSVSGKADIFNRKLTFTSPEYEIISNQTAQTLHTGRLVPVYPETKGVTSKWLRRQVFKLLNEHQSEIHEYMPDLLLKKYKYEDLISCLWHIHFPESIEQSDQARERMGFDELLLIQIKAQQRRAAWEKQIKGTPFIVKKYQNKLDEFESSLPFSLTNAQKHAITQVLEDIKKEQPMNRLVQGDVGSGKTIVGTYIMYLAHLNGFQSVMMAPTEILAEQHYATIKKFLEPFGMKVALVTGSKKLKNKRHPELVSGPPAKGKEMLKSTEDDREFDVLIGTHAVLNEKISFKNLGLVVIDEQQRFGVEQRSIIRDKGKNPHFLTMTATPIPRTVALTMYGDLDISYIAEMPKGRKQIKTWLVPPEKRDGAYGWIRKQVTELHSQIFIICPFIEESENMSTVKAAKVEFERLQHEVFPDLKLGMLHGKLKGKEKDQVLEDFRNKNFDILVATPVVEVGIDIPNATVIQIEASERFGLAQLHQLRGRVGRGDKQSYCLLFTETKSPITMQRLKSMETTHSGAELAEIDLKLRGPGDVFGTAQSGTPKLKIASFADFDLVERTKYEAKNLFEHLPSYPQLQDKVESISVKKVSPD